jgi:hypothetical protein
MGVTIVGMSSFTGSVWGRSERRGPFTAGATARFYRRLADILPWNSPDLEAGGSHRDLSGGKAEAYSFGPKGPTRRQRQEMERRQEQARRLDKVRMLIQAILVGLAALLMFLWAQWMR